ncbi:MAG: isoleucine--tRNA ligase [Patescibacteria group bacterium]|nr:isoleucine--tRNA ligase [Patescibacteria group bacterium]
MERSYDFKKIEEEVLSLWREHKEDIDNAISDKNDSDKERFTFLEGPPTANAPPALHHVEMRVFKDLFTRFKTLQGYKVSRKGGWDCHGLPVEVQVEKKLGLGSKKDVLEFGVDKFIDECKKDVFSFVGDWTKSTEKLAFWVDLDNPYKTLDTNYMESIWWSLSEMYKKDLLYLGHKIVPYCARCGTPLSSHEVAQGYKDIEEKTVVVTFPALDQNFFIDKGLSDGKKQVVFLAWTTTPWTLPSNLALAVHPKVSYAFIEDKEKDFIYVLAEDLVSKYFGDEQEIKTKVLGKELLDQKYVPLFDYFKEEAKNSFRIISADYVTTEDGTGIVHQAPAFGEDDNFVCKDNDIDFVNPVDDNGEFTEEVSDYKGMFVKDADKKIIEDLDNKGRLFSTAPYVHSYPFCWRCKTPLIYYAKDTWFIKVSAVKDKLIEQNKTINWFPETIKTGRFGNWLEGARDWALSRNKFWGTPLPIWVCNGQESEDGNSEGCGHQESIGSIAELKEKTGVEVDDLHIGTVNPLTYKCSKCGGLMKRTEEVIDCWYDSGAAPFAQLHYPFENKDLFEQLYPYDFIAEAIDQTRGWFYTLLVINTILFDKAPYKNVAVGGLLCDDKGEKMSKSKGNIVGAEETFDNYGVDGTRLAMTSYSLGTNIRYGPSLFKEQINPFFSTFWNSYFYARSFMDRFELSGKEVKDVSLLEDEWMISKTNSMVELVASKLENHEYNRAIESIYDFVNNIFSRTYIKLIRSRAGSKDEDLAFVFRYVISKTITALAPFTPYLSEKVYQDFVKEEGDSWSVHFSSWPKVEYQNKDLEKEFEQAQGIIQGILASRDRVKVGVRWPLSEVKVLSESIKGLNDSIINLIKEQTNIKNIDFVDEFKVIYDFKIDFKKLGEIFGTETGDVIPEVKKNMPMITETLNESDVVTVAKWKLERSYFKSEKIIPEPFVMAPFPNGEIYLDTSSNDDLEAEGFYREIARRVQNLRKTAGLMKDDNIRLGFSTKDDDLVLVIEKFRDELLSKVGASQFEVNSDLNFDHSSDEKVKDKEFLISLSKL